MEGGWMEPKDVFTLGLGLSAPWTLVGHRLDTEKRPQELHLEVTAERGALFPCPDCKRACKAHDFDSFTWQHLNFFQHHCFITARVPRVDCPDHGGKRAGVQGGGLDETASKRGHNYVTVFIDMDRRDKPVIFVTPGKGKACVAAFRAFMLGHGGEPPREGGAG